MSDELLDLVDENDRIIGEVWKSEAHGNPQLIHREALMLIYDESRRLLLQQRGRKKDHPLWWIESCAGHVPKGMSPLATAHKELIEELGFDCKLDFVTKFLNKTTTQSRFMFWYLGRYAGQPIKINREEVEQVRFFSKPEFAELVEGGSSVGKHSLAMIKRFWAGEFDPQS